MIKLELGLCFVVGKNNQYSLHKLVLFNYVDRRIVFTSSITIINPHKKRKTKKIDDHEENNKIISTIPSFSNSVLHSLIIMVNVTVMVHNVCAWCMVQMCLSWLANARSSQLEDRVLFVAVSN